MGPIVGRCRPVHIEVAEWFRKLREFRAGTGGGRGDDESVFGGVGV